MPARSALHSLDNQAAQAGNISGTEAQDILRPVTRFKIPQSLLILATLLVLGTLVATSAHFWRDQLQTDRRVSRSEILLAKVTRGNLRREISAQGKIVVANSPTLYSSADGLVTYQVKAGDHVQQGQLLLTVQSPALNSRFQQASAVLARLHSEWEGRKITAQKNQLEAQQALQFSELNLRNAQRDFARYQLGLDKGFVSQQEFDRAEENLRIAELKALQAPEQLTLITQVGNTEIHNAEKLVEEQQALVNELQRELNALQVKSPVDAMVGNLALNQNSAVSLHQPLITVIDLSHYEIEIDVPEHYAPELTPGMNAEIKLDNHMYAAAITAIAPEVNGGQVTVRLHFTATEPQALRQNQRITVIILLEVRDDVLKLPRALYAELDNGSKVFKINGEKAIKVPVTYGVWGLNEIEVVEGLKFGDEVIISDTSGFSDAKTLFIKQ